MANKIREGQTYIVKPEWRGRKFNDSHPSSHHVPLEIQITKETDLRTLMVKAKILKIVDKSEKRAGLIAIHCEDLFKYYDLLRPFVMPADNKRFEKI